MSAPPLSPEQILSLAPDAAAAEAGRKLASGREWQGLGHSEGAAWGEYRGSAVYQVRAHLGDLSARCSCPSRKFPCKHALGLLLMAAAGSLPEAAPPTWVEEWLTKRAETAERRARKQAPAEGPEPAEGEARSKRAADRQGRVLRGLEALDRWMEDLVRNGLAGLETADASLWNNQAARLVDAQAPGLAAQVRELGLLPGTGPEWPERMLERLGRLALLTEAWRRLDSLPPGLAADVRGMTGIALREEEVAAQGERVADTWVVVGLEVEEEERGRVQRTHLLGLGTGRAALVLQFAFGSGARFGETFLFGTAFEAELVYWPSAAPHRALVAERRGEMRAWQGELPVVGLEGLSQRFAEELARQPFRERTVAAVGPVVPVVDGKRRWWLREASGAAVRLGPCDRWRLAALSGGQPLGMVGEWNGEELRPLSAHIGGRLLPVGGEP